MPCKVNIYEEEGKTYIAGLRPTLLAQFFPGKGLEPIAEAVDGIVRGIVDEAI